MRSKRQRVRQCKNLAKQHVDNPDEPAAPDGDSGFAEWAQITFVLLRAELDKSLRETEAGFNDSFAIHEELNLERTPDHTTLCRWEQKLKTTILINMNTLVIKDVHYTTRKSWDGHIGMQVFRRNAEDLQILTADSNYSWSDLRDECRATSTRQLIKHKEHNGLKKAHNARMDEELYYQRWMSETGFSLLKQDDGEKLRSRSWHNQFRELTRKCIVHNLSQAES